MDKRLLSRYDAVKREMETGIDKHMKTLARIWEECGYDNETIEERLDAILKHNNDLFVEMVAEEEENRNVLIRKIEDYLKEAALLNKELQVSIPVTGYENLPLKEVEHALRYKLQDYLKVKEKRVENFMRLRKREEQVCDHLGIALRKFESEVLSEQQLADYDKYLCEKEAERLSLFAKFQETKSLILQLMQDLELEPMLDFERLVICQEDSAFKVTKENMTLLRQMHGRLEHQQEEIETEVSDLRMKLTELWDRLHVDHAYRGTFLGTHKGCKTSTLKALREEVKRCEELKRRNMKQFVTEIRKELEDWWNRCMVHEVERNKFVHFSSECYTEDLLELHEMELNKYRDFYQENVDIFQLAAERQQLWDKMMELEAKASDPDRLFHNRGGQLLQEEKERRQIQKELPKVEKELLKYIASYEERNGEPIRFYGECVANIIENQWLVHNNKKENQKKAKKVERTKLLEVESKLGAQKSTTKRKFGNTAISPVHGTVTKIRRLEIDRPCTAKRNLLFPRSAVRERTADISTATNMTTYTDFQDNLEALDQEGICRSSVLPGRCLRERNTPARIPSKLPSTVKKTPHLLTPAKPPRKNLIPSNKPNTPRSVPHNLRSVPNTPSYHKGGLTTPRLTAAKGRLPFII